jgi:hypothetical protein
MPIGVLRTAMRYKTYFCREIIIAHGYATAFGEWFFLKAAANMDGHA